MSQFLEKANLHIHVYMTCTCILSIVRGFGLENSMAILFQKSNYSKLFESNLMVFIFLSPGETVVTLILETVLMNSLVLEDHQ